MKAFRTALLASILAGLSFGQAITIPGQGTPVSLSYLFNNKMRWAGAWSSGTTFNPQDVVTYAGFTYVSLSASNLNNVPAPSGTAWWSQLSTAGSFPSGTALQYLRIAPNVVTTTYQFASLPTANPADYNFPALSCNVSAVCTPGGSSGMSLAIGANTLTMALVPLGVAGAHTVAAHLPHLLWVTGGSGASEACPISGGAGTSGQALGTITITCLNAHSGAFTIQSDSSGSQEAIYVAGPTGAVRIPTGFIDLWGNTSTVAAITIPDGYSTSFRGYGEGRGEFQTHGLTGDWIVEDYYVGGSSGVPDLGDFVIGDYTGTSHTSGSMIRSRYRGNGHISNITAYNCYDCFFAEGNTNVLWDNLLGQTVHWGLHIGCNGVDYPDCLSYGTFSHITMQSQGNTSTNAIRIEAPVAGIILDSPNTGAVSALGGDSIALVAVGTNPLNEVQIGGACMLDGHVTGIGYVGNGSSYVSNSTTINNCRITAITTGIAASWSSGLAITNSTITGGNGTTGGDTAIALNNTRDTQIIGNPQINSDGGAGISAAGSNTNLNILTNVCGNTAGEIPTYCFVQAGTTTGLNVTGNSLGGSTAPIAITGTVVAPALIVNNNGIDNVIPAIASASTLALPLNHAFTLTGATAVGTVTQPIGAAGLGAKYTFVATNASPGAWTAGATIGNTFTPVQNVPVSCFWDGTKVWCK